ncbi:MAG: oxidoreductase [Candidatus Doudnabacteria bacterium]|nr:oxidoreductase [Candidatus Doudnabacteria bacterium]
MFKYLDRLLNRITMYRLTLYVLIFYILCAGVFTLFDLMPFNLDALLYSTAFLVAVCWGVNTLLASAFRVTPNIESVYITAIILSLIILPASDKAGYEFLFWAGVFAMASKYVLAINRRHVFNPAAIAVVATFYILSQGASWWVGNMYMQIPLVLGGLVIIRKIRRWNMAGMFLAATVVTTAAGAYFLGTDLWLLLKTLALNSPIFYFATVMFTEPATTPASHRLQLVYGLIVGILFSPLTHIGNFYFTPELALVAGNIFSFAVSPRARLVLTFAGKRSLGKDLYEFDFTPDRKLAFQPGQYLEWTLGHRKADTRGNRRYFTIASSPTESGLKLGVKFHPESSSFKQSLLALAPGAKLLAGQLAGDFVLPADSSEKIIFIAGGIGITPYRSMLKYLLDKNEKRDIILFFSNKTADEIVYKDILDEAGERLGIKTVFLLTQEANAIGQHGRISEEIIAKYAPDYALRTFYISGTHDMVTNIEQMIRHLGIPKRQIKTDFFPGFV